MIEWKKLDTGERSHMKLLIASSIMAALALAACTAKTPATTAPMTTTTTTTRTTAVTTVTTAPTSPRTTAGTTAAIDAKALFAANCAACHGANRQGISGLGPALTPASLAGHAEHLVGYIRDGKPGTVMPSFKGRLSDDQIKAVAEFLTTVAP